jgi:hypothetical protein
MNRKFVHPWCSLAVDLQSGVALKLPTHRMVRRDVEKGIKKVWGWSLMCGGRYVWWCDRSVGRYGRISCVLCSKKWKVRGHPSTEIMGCSLKDGLWDTNNVDGSGCCDTPKKMWGCLLTGSNKQELVFKPNIMESILKKKIVIIDYSKTKSQYLVEVLDSIRATLWYDHQCTAGSDLLNVVYRRTYFFLGLTLNY